jgi:hypothetical protein
MNKNMMILIQDLTSSDRWLTMEYRVITGIPK